MVFSAPLANGRSVLATGGEDGVLRVWELCAVRNGGDAALLNGGTLGTAWSWKKQNDLRSPH